MVASLRAVGLINSVVLLEGAASAGHKIICGYRRLHGLRRLGEAAAPARLLPPVEFSTLEVFLKSLWDNLSHRQLGPLECARVLFKLERECRVPENVLVERFLPLLGLSPHRKVLRSYLSLHRLHSKLRCMLTAGHLTLASAERLAQAAPEMQDEMAAVLARVRLSASLQREVLDIVDDLAAISGTSPVAILNEPEILAIAGDGRLSGFQRGEKIYGRLYCRRYPRVFQARETFLAERTALDLPGTVRLSPDPYFETPRLRVEFDAVSAQAFRETVDALGRACRTAALDRLFKI